MVDGPAVRAAALDVKAKLLAMAAEQLKTSPEQLTLVDGVIAGPLGGTPKVAIGELDALRSAQQAVTGIGDRADPESYGQSD